MDDRGMMLGVVGEVGRESGGKRRGVDNGDRGGKLKTGRGGCGVRMSVVECGG